MIPFSLAFSLFVLYERSLRLNVVVVRCNFVSLFNSTCNYSAVLSIFFIKFLLHLKYCMHCPRERCDCVNGTGSLIFSHEDDDDDEDDEDDENEDEDDDADERRRRMEPPYNPPPRLPPPLAVDRRRREGGYLGERKKEETKKSQEEDEGSA